MSHSTPSAAAGPDGTATAEEVDVREIPKPQRHPLIFGRFDGLAVGESFVLVNSHDPKHLRQEFDRDHPGAYEWVYLESGDSARPWRIRITRLTAADLPRLVGDTRALNASSDAEADASGAVWKLEPGQRQLDANVIHLRPHTGIEAHTGPDLDVLLHLLHGSGQLSTATGTLELTGGGLVWLPRRSHRAIVAGPEGLSYLTVHIRRPGLSVGPPHTDNQ